MTTSEPEAIRLDPIMTYDGAFFWKAADEERFVAKKCSGCSRLWHPPRPLCPECLSVVNQEQELSGRGKVVSWAMPLHPPAAGFKAPPIVILVEVEEGLTFVSNLEGVPPEEVRIGMPVKVGFAKTRGGRKVPVFHRAEER